MQACTRSVKIDAKRGEKMRTDVNGFLGKISQWSDGIVSLYTEINEVQTAFNHRLVDLDGQLKKQLESATKYMKETYDSISPGAKKTFDTMVDNAKKDLDKIIADLKSQVKKSTDESQKIEKTNVSLHDNLAKENPELDAKEEALKADILKTAQECKLLEKQLAKFDGIRGWFTGGSAATLRKTFNEKMTRLESLNKQINSLRKDWAQKLTDTDKAENDERTKWIALQKDISTSSMELANIEKNYDALSFQNAITALTKCEVIEGFSPECTSILKKIKELRTSKEELVQGLVEISGTLATLKGINDGYAAFAKSVANLKHEQDTYSSLARLNFDIDDAVVTYNSSFTDIIPLIKDEKKMAENPKVYSESVKTKLSQSLVDKNIELMFDSLGKSITVATKAWK